MGIKKLSISQLEAQGPLGSVWVLNSGATSVYEQQGDILLTIPGHSGQQAQALKVQSTWLPFDLTTRFPKSRILESTDFRSAVQNELLTIIDETTARNILSQDGAKDEQKRMIAEARSIKEAGAARTIKDSKAEITRIGGNTDDEENPVEIYGRDEEPVNLAKAAAKGLDTDENGLTASFVMFAEKVGTENDVRALNTIRTRARFTRRELKYLRDNLKSHPKTVAAVKARLSNMKSKAA